MHTDDHIRFLASEYIKNIYIISWNYIGLPLRNHQKDKIAYVKKILIVHHEQKNKLTCTLECMRVVSTKMTHMKILPS